VRVNLCIRRGSPSTRAQEHIDNTTIQPFLICSRVHLFHPSYYCYTSEPRCMASRRLGEECLARKRVHVPSLPRSPD